jgi:hypothetical protein
MSYDPQDHTPSTKQVIAAWAICLGIVVAALGSTIERRDVVPDAVADTTHTVATAKSPPLTGVHIPAFAICRAKPDRRSPALGPRQRGPMSVPGSQC